MPANAATTATITQKRSSASRSRPKPPPLPPPLLTADAFVEADPHAPDAPPPPERPPRPATRRGAFAADGRPIGRLSAMASTTSLPSALSLTRDHFQRTQARSRSTNVA